MTNVDLSLISFDDDGEIVWPMQLLDIEPLTPETLAKERDVNAGPGGGHDLKNYWTKGKGAAKIVWKTPGDFTRCVANLQKHVKNPQGLCAEYHHAATGMWPGDKRNPGMKKADGTTVTLDDGTETFLFKKNQKRGSGGKWIDEIGSPEGNTGDPDLNSPGDDSLSGPYPFFNPAGEQDIMDEEDDLYYTPEVAEQRRAERERKKREAASGEQTLTFAVDDKGKIVEAQSDAPVIEDDGSWHGTLTREDVETGDGRMFKGNSLTWAELPLPIRYTPVDNGEHKGAVQVGNITHIERRAGGIIHGSGVFDLDPANPMAHEAFGAMKRGFLRGNSVDVDSVKEADVELVFDVDKDGQAGTQPSMQIFHRGRIRATTLVQIPAFAEATLQLGKETMPETVMASAAVDGLWHAHEQLVALVASSGGTMKRENAAEAFAWVPAGDTVKVHDCRFMHHTMNDDGTIGDANLTACAASIHVMNSKPDALDPVARRAAYSHLSAHIAAAGLVAPDLVDIDLVAASAPLITAEDCPPSEWFQDPKLTAETPITITADGRLFGHGALWRSCHTGYGDVCVSPPREGSHDYYRLGEVITADGSRIPCGSITLGTGHAPTVGMSARGAIEHYDHTGSTVADVVSGEDEFGIWVAGSIRPGLTASSVRELMGAKLSGDWRKIQGSLRLVAFLAVNVPGFGVPRMQAGVNNGRQLSLVASGIVPDAAQIEAAKQRIAIAEMKERLAKDVGLDIASKKAALVASLK